jgi:hypothetical protein
LKDISVSSRSGDSRPCELLTLPPAPFWSSEEHQAGHTNGDQTQTREFWNRTHGAGRRSKLTAPDGEINGVDRAVAIGVTVSAARAGAKTQTSLPDKKVGSIDFAAGIEVGLQTGNLQGSGKAVHFHIVLHDASAGEKPIVVLAAKSHHAGVIRDEG